MKKVAPVQSYEPEGYPSVIDTELARLSRRGFLRAALSTSAAAGVMLVAGRDTALAGGKRPKTYKTTVNLGSRYRFRYGNWELQKLTVQTRSARLVRFLESKKEAAGITKVVRKVLDAHTCEDLRDGKRIVRLQKRVASKLRAHYRKRTKRWVATPNVVIFVYVNRYRSCRGKCRPAQPYCRVPNKRPRPRK